MSKIKKYEYDFLTKEDMLKKLRDYATNPDDDNIRIKAEIYQTFLHCPELLYALHEDGLETELFYENENGNLVLNVDENGEPAGEWDRYFGATGNVRPFLHIPETQTDVRNYVCYQTSYDDFVRYNPSEKNMIVTFTIFVNDKDAMDNLTGIPRHDLIASIIREKFAWIGLEIPTTTPSSDKESTADNNYIVRTLQYLVTLPNSIAKTNKGFTYYNNKRW